MVGFGGGPYSVARGIKRVQARLNWDIGAVS